MFLSNDHLVRRNLDTSHLSKYLFNLAAFTRRMILSSPQLMLSLSSLSKPHQKKPLRFQPLRLSPVYFCCYFEQVTLLIPFTYNVLCLQNSTIVWELRVLGWEVSYGAEFTPDAEGAYTVIVQKTRKVPANEEPIMKGSFKVGESGKLVLTINNSASKKKKLLYRSKVKSTSE